MNDDGCLLLPSYRMDAPWLLGDRDTGWGNWLLDSLECEGWAGGRRWAHPDYILQFSHQIKIFDIYISLSKI